MQALIFGYLFIKKKVRALRRRWTCTDFSSVAEARLREGQENSERLKPLSAYRHLSPEGERTKKQITAPCNMLHTICTLLPGLGNDGRRKR